MRRKWDDHGRVRASCWLSSAPAQGVGMPDRRRPGEYRTSALGRVDWACWLAAVGFLFLTVVAVFIQFAILGVITAILAVALVAFDSWVNRPKTPRSTNRRADTGWRTGGTGWRSDAGYRGTPPPARAPRPTGPRSRPGASHPRRSGSNPKASGRASNPRASRPGNNRASNPGNSPASSTASHSAVRRASRPGRRSGRRPLIPVGTRTTGRGGRQ